MYLHKHILQQQQGRELNSYSLSCQNEVIKVITSRITEESVDKLEEITSSNLCELYFGVLTKFSEGKRMNLDHADAW